MQPGEKMQRLHHRARVQTSVWRTHKVHYSLYSVEPSRVEHEVLAASR